MKQALIFVSPGYLKKTGYYFRTFRDIENLESVGYSCNVIIIGLRGFYDESGLRIKFSEFRRLISSVELLFSENIAASIYMLPFYKKKRVVVVHGSLDDLDAFKYSKIKKPIYYLALKLALKYCDRIISVSNVMIDYLLTIDNKVGHKIHCIPNLPNKSFLENIVKAKNIVGLKEKISLDKNVKYLCYCGNSQAWQFSDYLIDLYKIIINKDKNIGLIVLTLDRSFFENAFSDIESNNLIIKSVDNDDVPNYLYASDLLYLIRDENHINKVACPTKAIEYLCSGTNIISSKNLGDISDYITEHNAGFVISKYELSDIEKVADKIINEIYKSDKNEVDLNNFISKKYLGIYEKL